MRNATLQQLPQWHYCNVRAGEKRPYPNNWQQRALELKDIESSNIGLLLGPVSHGTCALDFDGTSAWSWFSETIGCDLPTTVTWTSGKTDRCQMAFQVPTSYWFYLKTLQIKHIHTDLIADGEGFEFRWVGAQSVIPPSKLNDGRCYEWIHSPDNVKIAELPDPILSYWLQHVNPDVPDNPPRDLSQITQVDLDEIQVLLELLRAQHTTLDYDTWRTVAWATAHHVGVDVAQVLMSQYWPEKKRGEYRGLYHGYRAEKSPTIGSIRKLAGPVRRDEVKLTALQIRLKEKYGIKE